MSDIYAEIKAERERQDAKWGGPAHDDKNKPSDWYETIGAYNAWSFQMAHMGNIEKYRKRLVQIAALAIAAIESLERKMASRA